jgi:hypothetical protein
MEEVDMRGKGCNASVLGVVVLDLAAGMLLAACGCSQGELGTIQAHLASSASESAFASVRVDVMQGTSVVARKVVAPASVALANGSLALGGDASFAVAPGAYVVAAAALDASGAPVADCMATTTTATVDTDGTTAVTLGILCNGPGSHGLHVSVASASSPVITGVTILPGNAVVTDQPVTLMVAATAPSSCMPLSYRWSVAETRTQSPPRLIEIFNHANFSASATGDYQVTVSVTDARSQSTTVTIPIRVTDAPRPEPPPRTLSAQRSCRNGDETREEFAARCDKAMGGVSVPAFDCDVGSTEVPRQDDGPPGACSAPNVLNQQCDPGSHFHMLHRNVNNDGIYIAAHCRKEGLSAGKYFDVAVIQYNANTGATCFYQALGNLDHSAPAPNSGSTYWRSPAGTIQADPCINCHDTGAFVRSPYLGQLGEVWPFLGDEMNPFNPDKPNLPKPDANHLPGTLASEQFGPWNQALPYMFVGLNFQSWESYSVSNTADPTCTGCHRLGVSRAAGFWNSGSGTAIDLGMRATASMQSSKLPHGALLPGVSSPIWMMPGQLTFDQQSADHASAMQKCANDIIKGTPGNGCSAVQFARGNTCPSPPIVVNGSTTADDPGGWQGGGKVPLGQPNGRPGFYFFTSIHGPFYQNSPWDAYMNTPPAFANPAWDPPSKAPGFRGSYLRIYVEPSGRWMLAWGYDATDIKNNSGNPPPPGGPGGEIDGVAYDQIDSIPDPSKCGIGYRSITDKTGTNSPLSTVIDNPAGGSAAILSGFVGNVSRNTGSPTGESPPSVLRVNDVAGTTALLQSHINNPMSPVNQWFTAEAWQNSCSSWQASAHYAVQHVQSTDDVVLVPAASASDVICYIDGLSGDWSKWRSNGQGGSLQPYAQIYNDPSTGFHLKVWPPSSDPDHVTAFGTCLYLKN